MSEYEELVKKLRHDGEKISKLGSRFFSVKQGDMMLEAADAIEQLSTYSDFYEELTDKGIKTIRELLNKFPTWIPLEDREPDDGMWVLTCEENGTIKYWLPIPEPPKEEA